MTLAVVVAVLGLRGNLVPDCNHIHTVVAAAAVAGMPQMDQSPHLVDPGNPAEDQADLYSESALADRTAHSA